jgi:hypothetical protein
MRTERVTFLTSREHKAALDAIARENGMSVGHFVREATARYMAEGEMDDEERLALLLDELNEALPKMHASLDRSIQRLHDTRVEIAAMLAEAGLQQ